MKHIVLLLFVYSLPVGPVFASDEEQTHLEITEILQQAIDLPELQQYFHYRKPLFIELSEHFQKKHIKGLKKLDEEVQFRSQEEINQENILNYIKILQWQVHSGIQLKLQYPIEGVIVTYDFKKDYSKNKWYIEKSELVEY